MGKELNPAKREPCNKRNHGFTPFQQKYKHNTKIFPLHFEWKTRQRVYNINNTLIFPHKTHKKCVL